MQEPAQILCVFARLHSPYRDECRRAKTLRGRFLYFNNAAKRRKPLGRVCHFSPRGGAIFASLRDTTLCQEKYDINIEGEIGYWITGESVRAAMQPYAEREIKVRISSLGGSLSDGLDVCTLFRAHSNVTAYLNGMVASAATIIAMGARRIVMAPEAVMLVHNASSFLFYFERVQKEDIDDKHEELKQLNEMLTTFDKVIAEIYSKRTGKSVEEMEKLMKEERWLTAQEALEYGLVDEIDNYEDTTTPETGMTAMVTAMCNAHGLPAPPLNIVSEPTIIERVLAKFGIGKAANKKYN